MHRNKPTHPLSPSFPPSLSFPNSFPGLYESLHHKVRGQWDVEVWAQYLAYRAKLTNLPWDPNHGEVTAQKKAELKAAIAAKAGTTLEALGWSK